MSDRYGDGGSEKRVGCRRGLSIVYVALILIVVVGFVALGLDVGRAHLVKTELQVAADGGARAGAWVIPDLLFDEANDRAQSLAEANSADNGAIALDPDLDIDLGLWRRSNKTFTVLSGDARVGANAIRVTPKRIASRGTALRHYFAPAIGWSSSDVQASAIAMIRGGAQSEQHGWGLVGIDWIEMNGITVTDSYDPDLFDPSKPPWKSYAKPWDEFIAQGLQGDNGTIASNGDINLVGTVDVNGDARPGMDHVIDANPNVTITGWQAPLDEALVYPAPQLEPYNNAPIQQYLSGDGTFSLNGQALATLPGGTPHQPNVYYVKDFIMRANSTVEVKGPVKVYVRGQVDITGNSNVNLGNPADLEIIVLGSSDVDIGGGGQVFAHVYAPLANVTVHGTQDTFGLFGSVVGKSLRVLGNSALHYDGSGDYGGGPADKFYVQLVK